MKRKLDTIIICCCLFLFCNPLALQAQIPRDTSFTIHGTLLKEQKYRPYIQVANPAMRNGVKIEKNIVYKTIDKRQLPLDVFYPASIKELKPAVLLIFGGGWRSGNKDQNYAMCADLANNGYVAVTPEYRLSLEAQYPAAVYDLKTAIQWMRVHANKYGIDTNKIAVLGCSAGGQLAALLGVTGNHKNFEETGNKKLAGNEVQAVVDIDGTLAFHHPESEEGSAAAQWLGGTYAEKPGIWTAAAPLVHVNTQTPPFLFLNSSNPRFHAGRDDMINKLDSLHIYSEVHTFPDTPHPFWFFEPWFSPMMKYVVAFLNKEFGYQE